METLEFLTAEQFSRRRHDARFGRQWCELVRGRVVEFEPPSDAHGVVLMNLTRTLGEYCAGGADGYACAGTLLVTCRNPDTVRAPSLCFFTSGPRFGALDEDLTERPPELVVEVVSSAARRKHLPDKLEEYFTLGTERVWVFDVARRTVRVHRPGQAARPYRIGTTLTADGDLQNFACSVADLFHLPEW